MLHPLMLVPGPVNLSLRVQEALGRPVLSPLQLEYRRLRQQLNQAVLAVYRGDPTQWQALVLAQPIVHALEGVLHSLPIDAARSNALGVLIQGPLGQRWASLAQHLAWAPQLLQCAAAECPLQALDEWLATQREIRYLALAQVEAQHALLNDMAAIAEICQRHDVQLLIDASYSFAVEETALADWPVYAVIANSDGAVHAPPGLSWVILRQDSLRDLAHSCQQQGTTSAATVPISTDLHYWQHAPLSMDIPSPLLQAALIALEEHREQGGWTARRRRYQRQHEALARVLKRYSVLSVINSSGMQTASAMRVYRLPALITPQQFSQQLLRQGFILDANAQPEADGILISLMGDLDELAMSRLHHAVEDILHPVSVHISA